MRTRNVVWKVEAPDREEAILIVMKEIFESNMLYVGWNNGRERYGDRVCRELLKYKGNQFEEHKRIRMKKKKNEHAWVFKQDKRLR